MKAPQFWYKTPGILSTFLAPLGWIYSNVASHIRLLKKNQKFPIPIISVGNIVCGGAGKTPVAISLAKLLQSKGFTVHFVTRGYKGSKIGPLQVNPTKQIPQEVGDEALLLAQQAPTWVAKKRGNGIEKAIENGAELVILDDGHQTSGFVKDLSLVVVDSMQGFGNGYPLPAGPLREDLKEGLRRADGFIYIGKKTPLPLEPCFKATLELKPLTLSKKRVVAFCGIGFPQKFYRSVKDMNFNLVAMESFPDHYVYEEADLLRLEKLAQSHDAVLITTRKDWIKIAPYWQERLHVLDMSIQFQDEEGLYHFILGKIPTLMERS
ncbi:MAG: tetraacyldisaccharide 4'-kinase [Alphaproteobacteria bacterium]|nr:tetraacyldisaccharide 4'-kinase [Alphaproteobacteria bacterium]